MSFQNLLCNIPTDFLRSLDVYLLSGSQELMAVPGLSIQFLVLNGKHMHSAMITGDAEPRWIIIEIYTVNNIIVIIQQAVFQTSYKHWFQITERWIEAIIK